MEAAPLSFFTRLGMAFVCFFRLLFNPSFAARVRPLYVGSLDSARDERRGLAEDERRGLAEAERREIAEDVGSLDSARDERRGIAEAEPSRDERETHASGLFLLGMLQREGRLLDFVQEEVAGYSDAEVGAAARVVHEGCRRLLRQYLSLEPVMNAEEGATVEVPKGFDAQRIRLTGNLSGEPPYKGSLRHHGWATTEVRLPEPPWAVDMKILAPAEVELS